ncbi:MAG: adenosylcobinamide-phosphate synthase, partial [Paracoccaceae bacterium]
MSTAAILSLALLLDAIAGEPAWLWSRVPHPAVLMGRGVGWLDQQLNHGDARRAKGVLAVVVLGIGAVALGLVISQLGPIVEILCAAILLAQRSLVQHVQGVGNALRLSLSDGRHMVAGIVSRDCRDMTQPQVARAAIESAAENQS